MKIAIIHDYITAYGGAEKTFKVLTEMFPQAEVYTLFYDKKIKKKLFGDKKIHTSFLQKFPAILKRKYQILLPFMPIAAETLDFRDYDIVISASHSFAKGIITRPKTIHICYCYSPTRYLWDKSRGKFLLHYFRLWDRQAAERVDKFIAISKTVQQRIKKYYKKDSVVIYPPVEIKSPKSKIKSQNEYYLIVSQLRKYKRINIAVEAFNKLGLKLVIIGDGPERKRLQRMAKKNIKILGWQPDEIVDGYFRNCTAFIFPGEDDFGIAPVEAMAYGKPVLAYKKGGATETIIEGQTGEFFKSRLPLGMGPGSAVVADGVRRLRANLQNYNPKFIRNYAKTFSRKRFEKEFKKFVENLKKY